MEITDIMRLDALSENGVDDSAKNLRVKLAFVIGTRPHFVKMAALHRIIEEHYSNIIEEIVIHTGQHYDFQMSGQFFDTLPLSKNIRNLNVHETKGYGQVAKMVWAIGNELEQAEPNAVVVMGDTYSTLSGALAASALGLPLVHIEAGERSFNSLRVEERVRNIVDYLSNLLLSATTMGVENLKQEGFLNGIGKSNGNGIGKSVEKSVGKSIFFTGDLLLDSFCHLAKQYREQYLSGTFDGIYDEMYDEMYDERCDALGSLIKSKIPFVLVTLHRAENCDSPYVVKNCVTFIKALSKEYRIIWPLHPRMREALCRFGFWGTITFNKNIDIIPPVSSYKMFLLENRAMAIVTDSGGVQREAFFMDKGCIVLRSESEWSNCLGEAMRLCNPFTDNLSNCLKRGTFASVFTHRCRNLLEEKYSIPPNVSAVFGDGHAAEKIVENILKFCKKVGDFVSL